MPDDDLPTHRKAVYILFDVIALGFVLEGVPRLIRHDWAGGTVLLAIAAILIFVGIAVARRVDRVPNAVKTLWQHMPSRKKLTAALKENLQLKAELAQIKAQQSSVRTVDEDPAKTWTVPPNADQLVWNWRKMVSDVQDMNAPFPANSLVRLPNYPSLRPHLSSETRDALEGIQLPDVQIIPPAVHPILRAVLIDIDRTAKLWGLPTEPTQSSSPPPAPFARKYGWPILTTQRVFADPPSTNPNINYKDKIRMILTNATNKEVCVWTPLWEQSTDVQSQTLHAGSRFRLEGAKGWKTGDWEKDESGKHKEFECLTLKPGATFDCYIGLIAPSGQSIERRLQTHTSLGVALFPVKIDGKMYEERIEL